MSSKRTSKPRALEFTHPLKAPLERWILLSSRLKEVEQTLVVLAGQFSAARKVGMDINMSSDVIDLVRPLYCFAVVTYIRCFGGGRRQPLQISDVPRLTEQDLQIHEDVRMLRNQHFAHAVAEEESVYILAIPAQAQLRPGFALFDIVLAGTNKEDLRAFLKLVRKIQSFIRTKELQAGNDLARAIFGPKATWATCLKNGALATKGDAQSIP